MGAVGSPQGLAESGVAARADKSTWRVGLVGLGKLGVPVALAMSLRGHDVMGYDVDESKMQKVRFPHRERGPNGEPSIEPLLQQSALSFGSLREVVDHAEIIFVAVQTPHDPLYEGVTRLPEERVDFDYTFLREAIENLSSAVALGGQEKIVVVISTVLPGTIRREILPRISPLIKLCYNPFFIAMGTTIDDFVNPEFVLFGVRDEEAAQQAERFYRTLHEKPFFRTSIENAELIKVTYNTFISMKIAYANAIMEICHKTPGCNVDDVTAGLALATERLLSPKYMGGGMGDGAAAIRATTSRCHGSPVSCTCPTTGSRTSCCAASARPTGSPTSSKRSIDAAGIRTASSASTAVRSSAARTSPSAVQRRCWPTSSSSAATTSRCTIRTSTMVRTRSIGRPCTSWRPTTRSSQRLVSPIRPTPWSSTRGDTFPRSPAWT